MTARRATLWLAIGAVAAILYAIGSAAFGSIDRPPAHQWITDEPRYVAKHDPSKHCCSIQHCRPVPPDYASQVPGGWRIEGTGEIMLWSQPGLYVSLDTETGGETMWACVWAGATQCLFTPGRGV